MIKVTESKYFKEYHKIIGHKVDELIDSHDFSDPKIEFGFSTKSSAVYSSNIEGNTVDLNTYMNHKLAAQKFKPSKEIEEFDDLVQAYEFAQQTPLNEINFLKAQAVYSKTLLIKSKRGKYRKKKLASLARM